ncbi:MAG: PepSY domain-containing protein [Phenylobacterium sp.]|uniref:PepSY domain-containing protein n=1 Tax=Phenylobacterium sp. TaxID=1871053 RepID=UPI00391D7208
MLHQTAKGGGRSLVIDRVHTSSQGFRRWKRAPCFGDAASGPLIAQWPVMQAQSRPALSLGDGFTFDGQGELIHQARVEGSTLGEQILGVLGVLHFGWFGGWPIKVACGLLGAGLTAVTASGVAVWLARRRDKGRPALGLLAILSPLSPSLAPVASGPATART